jgi:multiple sugar transport system permease protein
VTLLKGPAESRPALPATKAPNRVRRQIRLGRVLLQVFLAGGLFVMLYPLLWMLASSVKPENEIFGSASLWPEEFVLTNYPEGWVAGQSSFSLYLRNSAVIAILAVIGNVVSCTLAAFAFARLKFRFRGGWFAIMLLTMMVPYHVVVVPQYIVFRTLGWIDTILPLVVPKFFAVDGFFVFLMVQFIRGLPRDLDEAAEIDGCGPFRVFVRIVLPLTTPAMVTTAIFTFMWTWDDFFGQLIYLNDFTNFTVPLGLAALQASTYGSQWGKLMAMSVISLIPTTAFFLLAQRRLIEGISTTGIRG